MIWMPPVCLTWVYAVCTHLFCIFWHKERVPRAGKWLQMIPQDVGTFCQTCLFWKVFVQFWQLSIPDRQSNALAQHPADQGSSCCFLGVHTMCGYAITQKGSLHSLWKCTRTVIMSDTEVGYLTEFTSQCGKQSTWGAIGTRFFTVKHSAGGLVQLLLWFLQNLRNLYFSSDIYKWGHYDMFCAQISRVQCPLPSYSQIVESLSEGTGEISWMVQSNLNWSVGKKANFDVTNPFSFETGVKCFLKRNHNTAQACQGCTGAEREWWSAGNGHVECARQVTKW